MTVQSLSCTRVLYVKHTSLFVGFTCLPLARIMLESCYDAVFGEEI
jgi:hypothetical protein